MVMVVTMIILRPRRGLTQRTQDTQNVKNIGVFRILKKKDSKTVIE